MQFIAWHGRTEANHAAQRDQYYKLGYRFKSLSIYGDVNAPTYAAVMVQRPTLIAQRDWPLMTVDQWQQTFTEQAAQGYGPVMLAAMGPSTNPRFAAVFQEFGQIPLTRHQLTNGGPSDPNSIQAMTIQAKQSGLILTWAASYGTSADRRFAAIWMPNSANTLWNNDGLLEDATTYQNRFNTLFGAWARPSFVTVNADNEYLSLFTADEIGQYVARHNMNPAGYQTEINQWTQQGYFPAFVQAAGDDPNDAHFTALFAKSEQTVPRSFTATGPVTNQSIDNAMKSVMAEYPVARHAALAIVHGTKLVYARGYTYAEPDWPIVEPTTYFRLASVSKTVAALAIYQLIEAKKLAPTDALQSILNLKTPSGGSPADSRFAKITIQHLLEHKAGLSDTADAYSESGPTVKATFAAAGKTVSLPVNHEETNSWLAGLTLDNDPGAVQKYSNCGYYLLGQVVVAKYGVDMPIEAYTKQLLTPLGISRIRASVDLIDSQPADEARYQTAFPDSGTPGQLPAGTPDLPLAKSVMSDDQPMVASGYGNWNLGLSQGSGGLSGAAVDVARLAALLIDTADTAAMKRATITSMLDSAVTLKKTGVPRAGYGLDDAQDRGTDAYYGQKGGNLDDAASVMQFNGDWGFVALWGSQANSPNAGWYPDFSAVMSVAKTATWGTTDLFTDYGMKSL